MYSNHNFHSNPYIASSALLPVFDCKGIEAPRLIVHQASYNSIHIIFLTMHLLYQHRTPLPRALHTALRYLCVYSFLDDCGSPIFTSRPLSVSARY